MVNARGVESRTVFQQQWAFVHDLSQGNLEMGTDQVKIFVVNSSFRQGTDVTYQNSVAQLNGILGRVLALILYCASRQANTIDRSRDLVYALVYINCYI